MHLKRSKMPNTWPLPRKTKKLRFIAKPRHDASNSITILVILRDILKIANTRKEAKYIINSGDVKINGKIRKDDLFPVSTFDTISLEKIDKYYRLEIVNKKFRLNEIQKKDVYSKTVKISGKKTLVGNKIQMNLEDGHNFIVNFNFNVGDSALLDTLNNKVEKILALKEKAKVEIVSGKHSGNSGKILSIEDIRRGRQYKIKLDSGLEVYLPLKTFFVIG